jgi:hypothetical protein
MSEDSPETPVADAAASFLKQIKRDVGDQSGHIQIAPELSNSELQSTEDLYRASQDPEEKRILGEKIALTAVYEAQRAKKWWTDQNIPWRSEKGGPRDFHYDTVDEEGKPIRLVVHSSLMDDVVLLHVQEWIPDETDPNKLNVGANLGHTGYEFRKPGEDVGVAVNVGRRDQEIVNVHNQTKFEKAKVMDYWTNTDFAKNRGKSHPLYEANRTNNLLEKAKLVGEDIHKNQYDATGNRTVTLIPVKDINE